MGLYTFKLTKNRKYKNPHAMPLKKRQDLEKQGYKGELKIRETTRLSDRPFGEVNRKGQFRFDIDKVPFYNIPDLDGFNLLPYVSHSTPIIDGAKKVEREIHLSEERIAKIKEEVDNIGKGQVTTVKKEVGGISPASKYARAH